MSGEKEPVKVIVDERGLSVRIPLTQTSGKVRVKARSFFGEYGMSFAARQNKLGLTNYVEWQISYDFKPGKGQGILTSLDKWTFCNYAGERKYAYELSEILYRSFKAGLVTEEDVQKLYGQVKSISAKQTIGEMDDMQINRTHPNEVVVNGLDFYKMVVKYPLLVRKFGEYDIYTEVMMREKQKGVGVQPMLYVCLPITSLRFKKNAIGRILDAKETADWVIGREEAALSLELFRIFGMLTPNHRHDILAILEMLFPQIVT